MLMCAPGRQHEQHRWPLELPTSQLRAYLALWFLLYYDLDRLVQDVIVACPYSLFTRLMNLEAASAYLVNASLRLSDGST